MSANKLIFYLAIVVISGIVTQVSSLPQAVYADDANSHHLIVGKRVPGDLLAVKENIIKNSSWMQIVTVQKTFYALPGQTITQVQALDQKTNGNGAYASLLNGGPGFSNVTLKFKSQRSHGINFVVEIYSR